MAKLTKFWDRIAEKYARKPVADEAAYEHKLDVTRSHLRPDSEVLEIGCGTGTTALKHAPLVKHIKATDFSPKMLEIARGKAAAAGIDNVSFEVLDVLDLDKEQGRYDVILAMSILHLLDDMPAALAEIRRLLKPGGVFISSTVCIANKMPWFKLILPIGRWLGFFPLVKVFTAAELRDRITQAGFQIDYRWTPEKKGMVEFIVATSKGD